MRRTIRLAAVTAGITAGALGPAAAAHAATIGFGPGPLGTASVGTSELQGTGHYVNVGIGGTYAAPTSVTGCPIYCANTLYASVGAYSGDDTGDGFDVEGQTADPLPYHALDFQYSSQSGPSLSES